MRDLGCRPDWSPRMRLARFRSMRLMALAWIAMGLLTGRANAHAGDQAPMRIVSLLPSLTEIVCALDACDRLVGTDRYSNHPAAVLRLPKVGGGVDPSVEAVLALKPDLVLAAHSTRANGRLRELGLRVLELEPRSLADLHNALLVLGHVLDGAAGRLRGQRLWDGLDGQILAVARALPPSARHPAQRPPRHPTMSVSMPCPSRKTPPSSARAPAPRDLSNLPAPATIPPTFGSPTPPTRTSR